MKKVLITILIIIVVAILAVAGFFAYEYSRFHRNEDLVPPTNLQADQTAGPALSSVEGWKTYTNTQYGFEIKIPNDAQVTSVKRNGGNEIEFVISPSRKSVFVDIGTQDEFRGIPHSDYCDSKNVDQKNINGVNFYVGDVSFEYSGASAGNIATQYCTIKNSIHYKLISLVPYDKTSSNPDISNPNEKDLILDQIISTFKFTTTTDQTAGWATYNGSGVSFKYPQAWGQPKEVSLPTRANISFPNGAIGQYDNGFYVQIGSFSAREGTANYQNGNQTSLSAQEIVNSIKNQSYIKTFNQQNIEISGKQGIRIDYNYNDTGSNEMLTEIYIPMDSKGNILNISSDTAIIGTDVFNQVISTFKFTN